MTATARLRALAELADTGSVRGAAERVVVSESAISSAVSGLSAEVGVPLVDRHGRGIRLTAPGSGMSSAPGAYSGCMAKQPNMSCRHPIISPARPVPA